MKSKDRGGRGVPLDSRNGNQHRSLPVLLNRAKRSRKSSARSDNGLRIRVIELHCCRSRRLSRSRACPDLSRRGARATKKRMTEAAKIYCVAGVAHTLRIFRFRDSSRARLSSLMRPMSLLESCSLEANSQRTRHFSGSCLSSIGRPLLKWQDQVRHCETRHVSYRVQRWTAVLELAMYQQFESCL